jgi:hypothetical protein
MDGATVAAYEIETTSGVDPATNRNRWIGAVMGIPSLTEDYMHQDYQPLGSGPDPHFVQKQGESFEVEVESLVDVPFATIGDNEFLSLAMGLIDGPGGGDTGVVTFKRPLRCFTMEWGYANPGIQVDTAKVLSAVAARVYSVIVDGFTFSHTAGGSPTVTTIRDGLVAAVNKYARLNISGISGTFQVGETVTGAPSTGTATVLFVGTDFLLVSQGGTPVAGADTITGGTSGATATVDSVASIVTAAAVGTDELTVTAVTSGDPFEFALTSDGPTPTTDLKITNRDNTSWFHVLKGCKINTVTWTLRPNDAVLLTFNIMGRIHEARESPVICSGVSVDELTAPAASSVLYSHATFTLKKQNGDVIQAVETEIVKEFDLTYSNNLERIFSDNQNLFASHLVEGNRRWTFNMKAAKSGNDLLDISRGDPNGTDGQLDLMMVIDQPGGWYMSLALPKVALAERKADLQSDKTHVEEEFAGVAIGVATLDMKK